MRSIYHRTLESDFEEVSHSMTPSPSPAPAVVGSPESALSHSESTSPKPVPMETGAGGGNGMEWEGPAERFEESDRCEFEGVVYMVGGMVYVQARYGERVVRETVPVTFDLPVTPPSQSPTL